ncbi:MAG: phosphoribosyl-AMP cyclohydrolase [Gammaproteobacteria bacterium]|nr:phosphoribosyl-AMP cyclohydrolase [Gammaproteobacteria bacterium]
MNDLFARLELAELGQSTPWSEVLAALKFNEQGLIPVIAQRHDTGEVLMFAWMNQQSLLETISTKQVCYWSRSRQALWRKGESSGHVQRLVELRIDCDGDVLLLQVEQTGPACHTERPNCFYMKLEGDSVIVDRMPEIKHD